MMFSRSAEYALRAFVYLAAQPSGKLVMAKQIAEAARLPGHFLAKILQELARKGLVRSNKGPAGGFSLALAPRELTLLRILDAVDGLDGLNRCPAGHDPCNDAAPCGMHSGWRSTCSRIVDYLGHTSVADLAEPGKKRLPAASKRRRKA